MAFVCLGLCIKAKEWKDSFGKKEHCPNGESPLPVRGIRAFYTLHLYSYGIKDNPRQTGSHIKILFRLASSLLCFLSFLFQYISKQTAASPLPNTWSLQVPAALNVCPPLVPFLYLLLPQRFFRCSVLDDMNGSSGRTSSCIRRRCSKLFRFQQHSMGRLAHLPSF